MQPVIIKRERVNLTESAPPRSGSAHSHGSPTAGGPAVRAIEHDGRVVAIEVTCACGEVSLVELRYPTNPESRP